MMKDTTWEEELSILGYDGGRLTRYDPESLLGVG